MARSDSGRTTVFILHHVGPAEHGLLARQVGRQIVEPVRHITDFFSPNLDPMAGHGGDQRLALDVGRGFLAPAPVPHLRVVVVGLARARELVHPRQARCIAQ